MLQMWVSSRQTLLSIIKNATPWKATVFNSLLKLLLEMVHTLYTFRSVILCPLQGFSFFALSRDAYSIESATRRSTWRATSAQMPTTNQQKCIFLVQPIHSSTFRCVLSPNTLTHYGCLNFISFYWYITVYFIYAEKEHIALSCQMAGKIHFDDTKKPMFMFAFSAINNKEMNAMFKLSIYSTTLAFLNDTS